MWRQLFNAMDADSLIALYVTAATVFTVIVLYQLGELAWLYLEPVVFALVESITYQAGRWRSIWCRWREQRRRYAAVKSAARVVPLSTYARKTQGLQPRHGDAHSRPSTDSQGAA